MAATHASLHSWISATRPKTLGASLAPCMIGAAIAWRDSLPVLGLDEVHQFDWRFPLAALAGAALLQVASNFANDLCDAARGADGPTRLGPTRAVASGVITPARMRVAIVLVLVAAAIPSMFLAQSRGAEFAWIGVFGAVAALLYTGGPRPLAYLGLGDLFVFVCFGPLATAGTYAAALGEWRMAPAIMGVVPGALAVALLATNNLRDIDQDRAVGKRTLAVRFGSRFTRLEILACWVVAAVLPIASWLLADAPGGVLAGTTMAIVSVPSVLMVARGDRGASLNAALGGFGLQLYLTGAAVSLGWALT